MKTKIHTILAFVIALLSVQHESLSQIKMKLTKELDNKTYKVSMVSDKDYDFPKEILGSVQLSLKVKSTEPVQINLINSQIDGVEWMRNNILEGSPITKGYNYYSFGTHPIGDKVKLSKNTEQALFTFQYVGNSTSTIELIDNQDPILPLVESKLNLDMYNNIAIHKRNAIQNDYAGNLGMNDLIANSEKDLSQITIDNAYPNPAQDKVSIQWSNYTELQSNLRMSLLDISGREVKSEKVGSSLGENTTEMRVGDLIAGTYLLQISNESKPVSKSHKIVVVK